MTLDALQTSEELEVGMRLL